jgi:hypothetical protein
MNKGMEGMNCDRNLGIVSKYQKMLLFEYGITDGFHLTWFLLLTPLSALPQTLDSI